MAGSLTAGLKLCVAWVVPFKIEVHIRSRHGECKLCSVVCRVVAGGLQTSVLAFGSEGNQEEMWRTVLAFGNMGRHPKHKCEERLKKRGWGHLGGGLVG